MRYLELMADRPIVWTLFGLYMASTAWLSWLGHRRTVDMKSYAIGGGNMSPLVVGITLAASIASTATFVINPGFVYKHGVSALLHIGCAVGLGVIIGLVTMSVGFRRIGAKNSAMTLPQWIGERYGSRALAFGFAAINLLSISFVVLIVGGISIVMQRTLGLTNIESLILSIGFVFGYVFVGGTYAHAYTNTVQGALMIVVSVLIVGSGLHLFAEGPTTFFAGLEAIDPNLVEPVNQASSLFGSFFSVYVSGFVIGFALVCQPHIMTKALYVKDDKAVKKYLLVAVAVSLVFSSLLIVGLYARLIGIGDVAQDQVMATYLQSAFSPGLLAVITVALLAAGMSTLDGILVALSAIAANDLFIPLAKRWLPADQERRGHIAHRASQLILVAMGVAAFIIALHPPRLLGIFGQVGVYGIVAASAVPIAFGIFFPGFGAKGAGAAALVGLVGHFVLYFSGAFANPAVTSSIALIASVGVAAGSLLVSRLSARSPAPAMLFEKASS